MAEESLWIIVIPSFCKEVKKVVFTDINFFLFVFPGMVFSNKIFVYIVF